MAGTLDPTPASAAGGPGLSRRGFLRGTGLGAASVALGGPAFLAACSSHSSSAARHVRVANLPLMIDDNTPGLFEQSSGVFLDYAEYTDADAFVSEHRDALQAHRDIGADVVILPDAQTAQLVAAGWVRALDVPDARKRLLPQYANPAFDPGRRFSIPYWSTLVGLAYDTRRVHTPVRSAGALLDAAFAGKVTLSADAAQTLGLLVLQAGGDPAKVTAAQAAAALASVRGAVSSGQIRSFATTEYVDDLVAGRALLAVARAADIRDARPIAPDLAFVVPDEGGLLTSTNMVVPTGARNFDEAQQFVEYMSTAGPNSRLASFANAVLPIAGAYDALPGIDAKAAADPLIQPSPAVWKRLTIWGGNAATAATTADFATLAREHRG